MQNRATIRQNLFRGTFHSEIQISIPMPALGLSLIADSMVRSLLPQAAYSQGEVHDCRGADAGRWREGKQSNQYELLFRVAGDYFSQGEIPAQQIPNTFEIRVESAFARFEGSHHIVHQLGLHEKGGLSDYLPLAIAMRDIGRLVPMRLKRIDLGMEFFESKRYMVFGFAPVVTEYFTLSATSETLALSIGADSLPSRESVPLSRSEYFEKLRRLLLECCNFDLRECYK